MAQKQGPTMKNSWRTNPTILENSAPVSVRFSLPHTFAPSPSNKSLQAIKILFFPSKSLF